MAKLKVEAEPPRAGTKSWTFLVKLDNQTIHADTFDPSRASARDRFLDQLQGRYNGLDDRARGAVEAELLKYAGSSATADSGTGSVTEIACHRDDNVLVEIAWNSELASPDLLVFHRDGTVQRAESWETGTGKLVPLSLAFADRIVTPGYPLEGWVLLPTGTVFENEAKLRDDIAAFINRYVELPDGAVAIAVEYVLLTWVHDAFDELPYLAFRTADVGRGKSRALETVGAICYRALVVGGGSSSAAVLRVLDVFGGTMVCDEFDQKADTDLTAALTKILNQGFQTRRPLVLCVGQNNDPRAFRCFGPKLFALRQTLGDDATESRTISIHMCQRTRDDIPINLPRARFDAEALALRNRLLGYRFRNLRKVKLNAEFADPSLEDRLNQIGLSLLSIAPSEATRKRIVAALRAQQDSIAADRAESLAGEIFAIVVGSAEDVLRPGDLAREVNKRRAETDVVEVEQLGSRRVSAHKVGNVLSKHLEATKLVKDAEGARYRFEPARLEQLKKRFGHSADWGNTVESHAQ